MKNVNTYLLCLLACCSLLNGCSQAPRQLLIQTELFMECPASPNCISSDSQLDSHRIDAFPLIMDAPEAWIEIRKAVLALDRTHIVHEQRYYLHAESRSFLFRFVDDLQVQLRESDNHIAVFSASRVGHSDFGANRERLRQLETMLRKKNVISTVTGTEIGTEIGRDRQR